MRALILWLAEDLALADMVWRLVDDGAVVRAGRGIPAEPELAAARVVGVLDPRTVTVRELTIPARNRRQLLQALPFALEEHLAVPVETQHVAHGARLTPGQPVRAVAMEADLLGQLMTTLSDRGLRPDSLRVASELLDHDHDLELVPLGEDWLYRTRGSSGVFPADWWNTVVRDLLRGSSGAVGSVRVRLGADHDDALTDFQRAQLEAHQDTTVEVVREPQAAIDWLSLNACDTDGIELLTGRFEPPRQTSEIIRRTRVAVAAVASAAVLVLAAEAARSWRTEVATADRQARAEQIYRGLFPDQQRITDPVAEMRQRLRAPGRSGEAAPGPDFLQVFSPAAGPLASARVDLRSINFNGSRGDALIEVLANSFADIDSLQSALQDGKLAVDISSANQQQQRIRARLRIALEASPQ